MSREVIWEEKNLELQFVMVDGNLQIEDTKTGKIIEGDSLKDLQRNLSDTLDVCVLGLQIINHNKESLMRRIDNVLGVRDS